MTDENDQLERAKGHDVALWTEWFEEHYANLYRYAYARTGRHEDAEDIASQAFVEALKGIGRFQDQGRPVLAWLYGIARHLIAQKTRKDARSAGVSTDLPLIQSDTGGTEFVADRVDLWNAIKQLTPEQQEVIVLRFFLGRSTREVADITSRQENAVYALQFRAINSLRRLLNPRSGRTEPGARHEEP